jgi:hypothetical protein
MASQQTALPVRQPFGGTMRRDAWWLQPTAVFLGLGAFIVYSTWAAFQGEHYTFGNYLSPFYSPGALRRVGARGVRPAARMVAGWLPFSPAFLILWAPGGFRLTCYYYRGAYYKAFWADPPNCAVGEPRKSYLGERHFPLILQNVHRYFLYLALVFLVILSWDVWKALWFADPATGQEVLGLGVGTLVLAINVILLGGYTLGCHSLRHLVGGRSTDLRQARAEDLLLLRHLPEPAAHAVRVAEPLLGRLLRPLRAPLLHGHLDRLEDLLMADIKTVEHDVLVIGAGGAGLRAAIEAAAQNVSVGLVCKSLLGKAHTVMAEGGIAASLANVDDARQLARPFRGYHAGRRYLNNWRMAELHAKEAPDRVRELEAWGALMDRTPDGRILQRNFGGHAYPRLAHVGDRTGLEMIRTLQDHGVHQGIDVHMEVTVTALLKDGERVVGALGYDRERGRFKVFRAGAVVMATGGIGKAYKITSNSWEYTGDGHALAYHAGADLLDMEFLQFHPTGMVWPPSVQGILVTEGVRGEGGVLKNSEGTPLHVRRHPAPLQGPDGRHTEERGGGT